MGNLSFGSRRGVSVSVEEEWTHKPVPLSEDELRPLEFLDLAYRALCAILYNYVPGSGHPGGSISSGRLAQALLFESADYDRFDPEPM